MGTPLYVVVDPDRFRGSSRVGFPPMKRSTTRVLGLATVVGLVGLISSYHLKPAALPPTTGP